ncbi:MAG: rod shape-determining protein RodA [Haliscomenobacter sp.]|nr:rod shape-determining protein RodA [Haliscomenobacter sp.]MBK9489243.1 rod shape-determining protein RodA [Haliscomenobacter sp.]
MLGKFTGTKTIDWVVFSVYLGLVVFGVMMIYASTYIEFEKVGFLRSSVGKQLIWMAISFVAMGTILTLDWKIWQLLAYPLYTLTMVLLLGVPFFGTEIHGNRSWYTFAGLSLQPSEFAKVGTAMAMAAFLSTPSTNLKSFRSQFIAFGMLLIPMALILMQGDLGSAIVFVSFFIAMYREGLSPNYYLAAFTILAILLLGLIFDPVIVSILILSIGLWYLSSLYKESTQLKRMVAVLGLAAVVAWYFELGLYSLATLGGVYLLWGLIYASRKGVREVGTAAIAIALGVGMCFSANYAVFKVLKPHQADRILVWLKPESCADCKSMYNFMQSKTAITSGGFLGKGFLQGSMTRYSYVPEQPTDFIFCTVGEEQGFIGALGIVALFLVLMLRLTIIAERQRSNFARVYTYCFVGILFIHFFINIGMTIGVTPMIGIPLPFISRGGSSFLAFSAMMGIVLKMDRDRYRL